MTGGNVTVAQLPTQTTTASGDSAWVWSATGGYTYQAFPRQLTLAGVNALTTATSCSTGVVSFLASTPAGFLSITVGGTAMKLPYYNA